MNKPKHQNEASLKNLPFFKGLDDDCLQKFLKTADIKDYPKGKNIFMAGDTASRFFVILDGWIKLYRCTSQGEESIVAIITRGDIFGETAIFIDETYSFSADVAENVSLLEIPAVFLRLIAQENPVVTNRIMSSMSSEIHKLQLEKEHLAIMTAPQRVGCLLIQLSSGLVGKGGTFTFPYDKSLAAARLGMKPETFSRALSQLMPFNVQVKGSKIHINDFDSLVQYVCGHCSVQGGGCRKAHNLNCSYKSFCS